MTDTTAAAPRFTTPPLVEPYPYRYLVHHHTQRCLCCGATHEWSEAWAELRLRSRAGAAYLTELRSLRNSALTWNLPIKRVQIATTTVPVCHQCYEPAVQPDFPLPPTQRPSTAIVGVTHDPKVMAHFSPIPTTTPEARGTLAPATRRKPRITTDDLLS